jgi:hypothetical protein
MAIVSGSVILQKKNLQEKLLKMTAGEEALKTQATLLKKEKGVHPVGIDLAEQVKALKTDNENGRKMIKALTEHQAQSEPFSAKLLALGYEKVDGLWLTDIEFKRNGGILLAGKTYQADLLPVYLEKLGHEASFKGTVFYSLSVEGDSKDSSVSFLVKTQDSIQETMK